MVDDAALPPQDRTSAGPSASRARGRHPLGARRGRRTRRGFSVALIGPDGAGKTAVARRLERELPMPAAYLYMGVNPDSANRLLPTTRLVAAVRRRRHGSGAGPTTGGGNAVDRRRSIRPVRALRAVLRLANRVGEEWYRQLLASIHLRRGRVVVFDRSFYADYYATDIAAPNRSLERRVHGFLLEHLYPRPDLVLLLDAPADVLYARKREGTIEGIERMRRSYREAGPRLGRFSIVDATAPQDAVAGEARRIVLAFAREAGAAPRGWGSSDAAPGEAA